MSADENSKRTRVEPVFSWLREDGGTDLPGRLTELADGLGTLRWGDIANEWPALSERLR